MALPAWAAALIGLGIVGNPFVGLVPNMFAKASETAEEESDGTKKTGWEKIGDYFSGKTNTDATNSATAALQEDAQEFNAAEAEKQRQFSHDEAEIARLWQEQMSNTAVQRQAADLQAAGFNPWLAANGAGASTGSVGMASGDSASSAQGQGINATKSGVETLAAVGITAAAIAKIIKLLK